MHQEILAHEQTDRALQDAKEQAEAANKAKSRYLTGISHELRSPLNSIMGYAQLLETDQRIPQDRREAVNVILRSSEYLADLIEGLLDISKIEAGRLDLHRNEVHLPRLLDQIVTMFRLQAADRGIEFIYTCRTPLPRYVVTDEKRLRQILINLLSNAIKFTHQGQVTLEVRYRNQVAEFVVRDTGIGISPEHLERIFRPFERIREPGMAPTPGTGLGLTITRLLTDIMGGDIAVDSEPGCGSTFRLSLMLSSLETPSVEPALPLHIRGYVGARKNVLVVDDDPHHRTLVQNLLTPLGFSVAEAEDAAQCLALIQTWTPDLLLLDVAMPGMNGIELAHRLRELRCQAPIVMISADAHEGHLGLTENPPHDDYLVKPLRVNVLLERMASLLAIQWLYDTPAPAPSALILRQFDPSQLPDSETLASLKQMAEIGHLQGLRKTLARLQQTLNTDPEFLRYLETAITQVRLDCILNLQRTPS